MVQTCWDADRTDLGRVAIIPRSEKLYAGGARDFGVKIGVDKRIQKR